jgi:serine/threonine protein kinase
MATLLLARYNQGAVNRPEPSAGRSKRRSSVLAAPKTAAFPVCRFGAYRLLEPVERPGAEGPAEMYQALWTEAEGEPERLCVLKRLREELASSPTFVRMFEEETRVLTALDHPNIVRAYDHGCIDGVPYVALEALEGVDLMRLTRSLRADGKLLPVEVAVYIAHEVASGLAYAHEARDGSGNSLNLVHRDLQPGNVVLLRDGAVKLVQFGVARVSSFLSNNLTSDGLAAGKPVYVAPEQVKGAPLDGRADLFSLGALLWEMLTGRPLFPGSSTRTTAARLITAELKQPSVLRTDVPELLDAVVMRLLDRDVDRRYQSAHEVALDLGKLLPAPADDRRAVCSLVHSHLDRRVVTPPPRVTGGKRPITRVVPVVAAAFAKSVKMGQFMGRLPGRLPGSIRKVTGLLPIIAAKLPRRRTTTNPSVVTGGRSSGTPLAAALAAAPLFSLPPTLARPMARMGAKLLAGMAVLLVAVMGWRGLRASAAPPPPPVQIASDEVGLAAGVVIERLPGAVVIPVITAPAAAAPTLDAKPAVSAPRPKLGGPRGQGARLRHRARLRSRSAI